LSGHLSVAGTKVGPAPTMSDTDVRTSMTRPGAHWWPLWSIS